MCPRFINFKNKLIIKTELNNIIRENLNNGLEIDKMSLKVIRYKNYGAIMSSEDGECKFYYSFYELNNGKIINLEVFKNSDIIQYSFNYPRTKLNTGEIRTYKFGNAKAISERDMSIEFFEWFENLPPMKDVIDHLTPSSAEEKCIENFYFKHIEKKKDTKTDTIIISNKN